MITDLPRDDRWFLAYDPPPTGVLIRHSPPWVIATRCDGGFCDTEGYPVNPQRWASLPDPQPQGSGWKWPEGTIEVCRAKIKESGWSGWMAHIVRPDGHYDDREPYLHTLRPQVENWARKFADWSGLPIHVNDTPFDIVVPFRRALHDG